MYMEDKQDKMNDNNMEMITDYRKIPCDKTCGQGVTSYPWLLTKQSTQPFYLLKVDVLMMLKDTDYRHGAHTSLLSHSYIITIMECKEV